MRKRIYLAVALVMLMAQTTRADCPASAQHITIVFGNGIETTLAEAQNSLDNVLASAILQALPPTVDQSCVSFVLAYDSQFVDSNNKVISRANMLAQIADAGVQIGIDFAANFWSYWYGSVQPPTWFQDLQRQFILSVTSVVQKDLLTQEALYNAELAARHRVIVVAHSQGNLYANQAFELVTASGGSDAFHIVAVATPASDVAGSGPYFTLHGDIITLVPGHLPANQTNDPPSPCPTLPLVVNEACHNFDNSYMDVQNGDHTRPAIVNAVLSFLQSSVSQVSFSRTDYPTGSVPVSVATGDFNGDGELDLAIANLGGTGSVLLGNGDGTFRPKVDYPQGLFGLSITTADFNSDGKLDLAVAGNGAAGTFGLSVLLGNGDGTFGPPTNFQIGGEGSAIVSGDFNNDGKKDLAIVKTFSSAVSILLGKGDGTFLPPVDYATGNFPTSVVVGDFNRDGVLDLATSNPVGRTVSVFLGNGDGSFKPKADFAAGVFPLSLISSDFNHDGKLDLAAESSGFVVVLLGQGDGTFGPPKSFGNLISQVGTDHSIVAGDFNLDGNSDVAELQDVLVGPSVEVLLGNADGTLGAQSSFPAACGPASAVVADFNGDGKPDLAVVNQCSNSVSIFLNTSQ